MATCNPHPNAGVAAKEVNLPTRQDVYVEKQRPLWSYRTSILQVGRAGSPAAEYRTFLDFDLTSLAASGSKIIRAALVLHPLLAASGARLTHYACLLKDSSYIKQRKAGKDPIIFFHRFNAWLVLYRPVRGVDESNF